MRVGKFMAIFGSIWLTIMFPPMLPVLLTVVVVMLVSRRRRLRYED
jgi:hypothetical protein